MAWVFVKTIYLGKLMQALKSQSLGIQQTVDPSVTFYNTILKLDYIQISKTRH